MTYQKINEAAKYYATTPQTLRKLAAAGKVPAVKVGGRWRFLLPVLGAAGGAV